MNFTDSEIDMLIAGCIHYRNVYGDLAEKSAVARQRKQLFIDLRARLQAYKDERLAYFDDDTNGATILRDHPGYDDDCHI